jgi:phospholipid-binding lipoprotein MlaA
MRIFGVFALGLWLSACAGVQDPSGNNDPYEQTNRAIFGFNVTLDQEIFLPGAIFYVKSVPEPVRDGVHNVLSNLDVPTTFANDMLQGELDRGGESMMRLIVNTTVGVGGIFDVATKIGIPYHTEDFGQTLAVYGMPEGPYLMLPVLGPDPPRDLLGDIADVFLDPTTYIALREHTWYSVGRGFMNSMDSRSRNIDTLEAVRQTSVDFYASVRSLYRQNRDNEIRNGKTDLQNLPNY